MTGATPAKAHWELERPINDLHVLSYYGEAGEYFLVVVADQCEYGTAYGEMRKYRRFGSGDSVNLEDAAT